MINPITGELTKFQKLSHTIIFLVISVPILLALLCVVVFTFLMVQSFKNHYGKTSPIYSTLAGIFQGIFISILNYVYYLIATVFANKENHKYQYQFE